MTTSEKVRCERLQGELQKRGLRLRYRRDRLWLQWEHAERYYNWFPLVPDLYEECDQGDGTITTYFADKLVRIAAVAIPAINDVEAEIDDEPLRALP